MFKSCSRCKAWNEFNCLLDFKVELLEKDNWAFWRTDILNGFYVKIKPIEECSKPLTNKHFKSEIERLKG